MDLEKLPIPLSTFYEMYKKTRQRKATKCGHLLFELDYPKKLRQLCIEVNNMTYKPKSSIAFIITKPKVREVIAADFVDRIAQTLLVQRLLPYLEKYEHPYSFSCRTGKGSLKAVEQLREHIRNVSQNYTKDCYVCSIDFKNFFMSIDIQLYTNKLLQFIEYNYVGEDKEIIKYLTKAIYLHRPQNWCYKKTHIKMWDLLQKDKSLFNAPKDTGIAIGNVTSQTLANFITTSLLQKLDTLGYHHFSFYTDDCVIVVEDKKKFLRDLKDLRIFTKNEMHLCLHPNKFYIQHFSKGINYLGFRLKNSNITPSKRIVHNFKRRIDLLLKLSDTYSIRDMLIFKEKAQQYVNSYLGLLRRCNSYNIRKSQIELLKKSTWNRIFNFCEYDKIIIKKSQLLSQHKILKNKRRKIEILHFNYE